MQAFQVLPPGGWSSAAWRDVDEPRPEPQQAVVAIRAVGLNPADAFQIEGIYPGGPTPPFIVGRDAAGVVIQGDEHGRWTPGTEVVVLQSSTTDLTRGTLCDRQAIDADNLAALPSGWTFADGAAAPLVMLTAYKALHTPRPVIPGDVVVVTGASGGVGLATVQLALAMGATVVALSRSAEKRDRLLQLGVQHALAADDPHLKSVVKSIVGRSGVQLVVENVGGASLETAVHLLGVGGRVCVVGVLAGATGNVPIPSLMFKRASIHGILVTEDAPEVAAAAWSQIVRLLAEHHSEPVIDSRFPRACVTDAFQRLRGDLFGKVVVEL
jgi:NADPH:quinone reductase